MNYYYCKRCGNFIYPRKLGRIYIFFGLTENYCHDCGEPTETAISYKCEEGHSITKWNKFCEKCGSLRYIKTPNEETDFMGEQRAEITAEDNLTQNLK